MEYNRKELLDNLERLIRTPSVTGYYKKIHPVLEEIAAKYGYEVEYDNRHTAYIKVPGKDSSRTVALSAHLDTIGLYVRAILDDGTLMVRNVGGINCHSLEGENMIIHTHDGKDYTGMLICKSHSVHVFDDARELERVPENMRVVIDEEVSSAQDVLDLGILPGDLISSEPRFVITPSGYIKSRHLDDKMHAAVLLEILRILKEKGLQPAYDTWFVFNIYEEIGMGARYVPEEVDEFIAMDIAVCGGVQCGSEMQVTIAAADRISPYDWDVTDKLIRLARENHINACTDVFYRYSSDATAAISAGQNLSPGLFGAGVLCSHGYERTHIKAIEQALKLAVAYILSE